MVEKSVTAGRDDITETTTSGGAPNERLRHPFESYTIALRDTAGGPEWKHTPVAAILRDCADLIDLLADPPHEMKIAGALAITEDHMRHAANYDAACDCHHAIVKAATASPAKQ